MVDSKPLFFIYVALSIACEGGHFTIFATVSANIFGVKTGAIVYAILFVGIGLSSIAGFVGN